MIKLKVERYRDFTEEERKEIKERRMRNDNLNYSNILTPYGIEKYLENVLDVEITQEQFEAIKKAVLDNF